MSCGAKTGWYVEKERLVNMTEYFIVREPDATGKPKLCLGVFRGLEELEQFCDALQKALDDGRAQEEARAEYEQIIAEIRKERGT